MIFKFHEHTKDFRQMPISRIMDKRELVTVHKDMDIPTLLRLFSKHRVTDFPVVDKKGKLIGDVDMRDILPFAINPKHLSEHEIIGTLGTSIHEIFGDSVEDIMNRHEETLSPDARIEDAVLIMWKLNIHCIPIVDKGKLVGIISEDDIVRLLIRRLRK
jgi:CBS domain-containing protein